MKLWLGKKSTDDFHTARLAFLPAVLEVEQTPPHPLARQLGFSAIAFFLIAVTWAVFGKVDIVAVAEGKIVPSSRVQQIQPLEKGVIKHIYVREGQQVRTGELLVEMDRTSTLAERGRIGNELQKLEEVVVRERAFLGMLEHDAGFSPGVVTGLQAELLDQQWQKFQAQQSALQSQLKNRRAEKQVNLEVINKLREILPINVKRTNDLKALAEKRLVARDLYLQAEELRITQQQDLAAAHARDVQLDAAIVETESNWSALQAQVREETLTAITNAEREALSLRQQLARVSDVADKQLLYAPVSGQVKDLAVNTEGGVVLEAQQLMVIVPDAAQLEVEAWLPNKDIGFVSKDAMAVIKVNTFPFTKYGTVSAQVMRIADDAVADEKTVRENGGLMYRMGLLMSRNTIWVDGHEEKLMPGMQVTAEIITGRRRIIEYFLSPIQRQVSESVRER